MTVIKYLLAATLSFVFVFEALAMVSLLVAIGTNSIPSSEHTSVALGTTFDVFVMALSGYWALRLFGVIKKRSA